MLHLYYCESLLEQHGIFYGYKIGPRMMGIQVGYNKNYHRKCWGYNYLCKPPRRGRVTQIRLIRKKPKTKREDGGSIKGLKPTDGLRPVVINRRNGMTCVVRQD